MGTVLTSHSGGEIMIPAMKALSRPSIGTYNEAEI
jgi:hypothetical protein